MELYLSVCDDAADVAERDWKRVEAVTCCEGRWRHVSICDRLEWKSAPSLDRREATRGASLSLGESRDSYRKYGSLSCCASRGRSTSGEQRKRVRGRGDADSSCRRHGGQRLARTLLCDAVQRMEF
ncbi:hypothetical protein Sjap_015464 [Stephania japonica]|uniref:Uncharacterized protein n=1 Tax=Stephania japonica TaxID=461633 RepID=A0AAP0IJF8_9MAGN